MKIKNILLIAIMLLIANYSKAQQITVYTIGDSTMANKPNPEQNPERGWGQMLQPFFTENVIVDNRAVNGRSTRSFRNLKHWEPVYNSLKPGDYVFIQFGHNDGKLTDSTRYTNPHSSYRHNLIRYVQETRGKGAIPVLFSSIARRKFNNEGVLLDSHGAYTLETRLVAQDLNVTFIDLQYYTELLEESYGPEKSKNLHLHFMPGENDYLPKGLDDNTHLSVLGATEIATIAVEELKKTALLLVKYIKE
ncbi:rhamnogalacturonan acetylesterase [Lutibacter sp.]|uniref:rhamnogalacturonan acetylesterase n=1 Tax=Lutibacter sp. TaxID=1925666 RepID=UPI001A2C4F1A|nr:rhamnogalacturonan acetylesterase [Lutibacter sp.]MBI9039901.1 rhamnogalacturonan acetylesterase [Lutibacter sp.]